MTVLSPFALVSVAAVQVEGEEVGGINAQLRISFQQRESVFRCDSLLLSSDILAHTYEHAVRSVT